MRSQRSGARAAGPRRSLDSPLTRTRQIRGVEANKGGPVLKKLLTACLVLSLTTFAPAATTGCATFQCLDEQYADGPCKRRFDAPVECARKGESCSLRACCSGICVADDNGTTRCR